MRRRRRQPSTRGGECSSWSAVLHAEPAESGAPVIVPNTCDGHPAPNLERAVRAGGMYLETTVCSTRRRITSQLHALLVVGGRRVGALSLCRHGTVGTFREPDVALLRQLVPAVAVGQAAWTQPGAGSDPRALDLTPREQSIAVSVARGMRNVDIAHTLGTSPNTVRNQLVALYRKLELSSRAELSAWAVGLGLVH
jgi:DNA-binding CsgD family transcriptional regulator